jgi:hypothetical protein
MRIALVLACALAACGGSGGRPLTAYLTGQPLKRGQACPVTRPGDRREPVPAPMRQLLAADAGTAYGRGGLWVLLPYPQENASRADDGRLNSKIAWYIGVSGHLHAVAKRLDGRTRQTARLDVADDPSAYAHRMQPSTLTVPAAGCWQVAGRVGRAVLVWTYATRLAQP